MKTVYLDSEFLCHVHNDGTMTASKTDFFDGKCDTFIEEHRFVPDGKTWMREDGKTFSGPMITPRRDNRIADAAQAQYERDMAEAEAAYQEGVNSV